MKLILYVIAYSAGIIRLALAVYMAVKKKARSDIWKISFLVSFAVLIISLSNMETFIQLEFGEIYIFGYIAAYCSALMILTIPLYVHYEIDNLSHIHLRNSIFASLSSVSAVLITVPLFIPQENLFGNMLFISVFIMSATIIYSMLLLVIHGKKNHIKPHTAERILPVAVIVLIPIMIWIDFIKNLANGFIILPVLYLLINILMIIGELRHLGNLRAEFDISSENMNKLGLTAREQEVALCLLKGLTYVQTADKLCISLQTVKTHATRIYSKTGTQNKLELLNTINRH